LTGLFKSFWFQAADLKSNSGRVKFQTEVTPMSLYMTLHACPVVTVLSVWWHLLGFCASAGKHQNMKLNYLFLLMWSSCYCTVYLIVSITRVTSWMV